MKPDEVNDEFLMHSDGARMHVLSCSVKQMSRIVEKYGGDFSKILDVLQ